MNIISDIAKSMTLAASLLALSACSFFDVVTSKAERIDGQVFYYDENGELLMSEEQLNILESNGSVVRIKHVAPNGALILDPEEMTVLMQDREVFYSQLDRKSLDGEITVLIKKGSLKENIERIAKEEGWNSVNWDVHVDYYVSEPFAVVGGDVPAVVVEALEGYPVFTGFDLTGLNITIGEMPQVRKPEAAVVEASFSGSVSEEK
ncbi:hypothetical protein [Teredinibacter purpureus]|uniref:hypothetical protein n=2 Tax=Teredinibacter purpureus TaxID=2731756 RepID=UPI0005F85B43|nr:hypothetical protein [Teredinibacter purpureus]